jgi:hypothetical protein
VVACHSPEGIGEGEAFIIEETVNVRGKVGRRIELCV